MDPWSTNYAAMTCASYGSPIIYNTIVSEKVLGRRMRGRTLSQEKEASNIEFESEAHYYYSKYVPHSATEDQRKRYNDANEASFYE